MTRNTTNISGVLADTLDITSENISDLGGEERRQYARRAARWHSVITTHDKTLIQCRSQDVSERGASITSPVNFKLGTLFVLEINVAYKGLQKKLRILAEVKHTSISRDEFTLGLFFKDASEVVFDFLKKYSENLI